MSIGVKILNLTVVSPFVGDVKSGCYWAAVGIDATFFEEVRVQLLV